MTETPEDKPDVADYYQASGGLTFGMSVAQEGEVIEGNLMGFTKDNPPLSEEEQEERFGRVMYREYEPEEEELAAIKAESGKIRALMGMQHPEMPPVEPTPTAQQDLTLLSRQELRVRAKQVGLNFPEDTDRDQMIGAIDKKEKEGADSGGSEPEAVTKRRATAKAAIEKNNQVATGSTGGTAPAQLPAPEEEEEEPPA